MSNTINWSKFRTRTVAVIDPDTHGSWGIIIDGRLDHVAPLPKGRRIAWVRDGAKATSFLEMEVHGLECLDIHAAFVEQQFSKSGEGGKLTSLHTLGKILAAASRGGIVYGISSTSWHKLCKNYRLTLPEGVRVPATPAKGDALGYALANSPEIMSQHITPVRGADEVVYRQSAADVVVMAHYVIERILASEED